MPTEDLLVELYRPTYLVNSDAINQFRRINAVASYAQAPETTADALTRWFGIFESKFNIALSDSRRERSIPSQSESEAQRSLWSSLRFQRKPSDVSSIRHSDFSSASEYWLNCFQIARVARSRGFTDPGDKFVDLDRQLRTSGSWIEKSFVGETSHERNTFLLPYDIERAISAVSPSSSGQGQDRPTLETSADILEDILNSLEKGPLKSARDPKSRTLQGISRYSRDFYSSKFDQLSYIHHEISENALAHGIGSTLNDRLTVEAQSYFGNIFYCQVGNFKITPKTPRQRVEAIHPSFPSYLSAFRNQNRDQTFWIFCYCDNGPGIVNHANKFLNLAEGNRIRSIRRMIENQISTRAFAGSGLGLRKIREFTQALRGLLIVETSGLSYFFDGMQSKEDEDEIEMARGSMLSVIFPVS